MTAEDRMPATIESLARWAESRDLHYVPYGFGTGLLLGGAVSVTFGDGRPVIVERDGYRGDFPRGLPLAALTGLVAGFLGLEEVPGA